METVADFIYLFFWGAGCCRITADVVCSNEIKIHLFLGREVIPNLYSILKGKDTINLN